MNAPYFNMVNLKFPWTNLVLSWHKGNLACRCDNFSFLGLPLKAGDRHLVTNADGLDCQTEFRI